MLFLAAATGICKENMFFIKLISRLLTCCNWREFFFEFGWCWLQILRFWVFPALKKDALFSMYFSPIPFLSDCGNGQWFLLNKVVLVFSFLPLKDICKTTRLGLLCFWWDLCSLLHYIYMSPIYLYCWVYFVTWNFLKWSAKIRLSS